MAAPTYTAVEAARASRRWLSVPIALFLALSLLVGVLVLVVSATLMLRYSGDSTPYHADEVQHFRYGSIGADRASGLPYRMWQTLPDLFPEVFAPALARGDGAYAAFGFLYERDADGRPRDLPIGISRRRYNGVELVWFNCAVCHTGTWREAEGGPRRIVDGMPANNLDLHGFVSFLLGNAADDRLQPARLVKAIEARQGSFGLFERLIWRFYVLPTVREALLVRASRMQPLLAAQPAWGPGRVDTFNPYKVIQFAIPFAALAPAERIGTSDFPSIFNQRPREGMQLHWDGNNTSLAERNLSAAVGAGLDLPNATEADHEAIRRVARWLLDLRPPPSPSAAGDAAASERGRALYMRDCAACHGYRADAGYVFEGAHLGAVDPILRIGTDRARLDSYTETFLERQRAVLGFTHFRKTDGYANQPLDALWLRGPYLHNGSVPTLADLLAPPAARPRAFLRGSDVLDAARGGFASPPCTPGQPAPPGRHCYDTRLAGNGNEGHLYGTALSDAEKADLLSYLKQF